MPRQKIEIDWERVIDLFKLGLSTDEVCDEIECSDTTLYRRLEELERDAADGDAEKLNELSVLKERLTRARRKGRVRGKVKSAGVLMDIMDNEELPAETRMKAAQFYLTYQGGWTKKDAVDVTSSDGSLSSPQRIAIELVRPDGNND